MNHEAFVLWVCLCQKCERARQAAFTHGQLRCPAELSTQRRSSRETISSSHSQTDLSVDPFFLLHPLADVQKRD